MTKLKDECAFAFTIQVKLAEALAAVGGLLVSEVEFPEFYGFLVKAGLGSLQVYHNRQNSCGDRNLLHVVFDMAIPTILTPYLYAYCVIGAT